MWASLHTVLIAITVAALLFVTACGTGSGGSADPDRDTNAGRRTTSSAVSGSTRAAVYVDVWSQRDTLSQIADKTGIADFILAFALSDNGQCVPSWGGTRSVDDADLLGEISDLRSNGGTITVATGGASGDYLENACSDAGSLASAYGSLLDVTGSTHLDVDVEQEVDIDTVVDALSQIQQERGTEITLTLQVQSAEKGLTSQALDVLAAARDAGLDVTVNAMVMNFRAAGDWGAAMVTASDTVTAQLQEIWSDLDTTAARGILGLTYMIGVTDIGAVTTQDDAAALVSSAVEQGTGSLSFWSIARDNGSCAGNTTVQNTCSGLSQDPYAFATALTAATA